MMNQLCCVCVDAVTYDEYGALDVITIENVNNGPVIGDHAARARVLLGYAMTSEPEDFGYFRQRGSGRVFYVFAVTVVGGEPRCAMHIREQLWRV